MCVFFHASYLLFVSLWVCENTFTFWVGWAFRDIPVVCICVKCICLVCVCVYLYSWLWRLCEPSGRSLQHQTKRSSLQAPVCAPERTSKRKYVSAQHEPPCIHRWRWWWLYHVAADYLLHIQRRQISYSGPTRFIPKQPKILERITTRGRQRSETSQWTVNLTQYQTLSISTKMCVT